MIILETVAVAFAMFSAIPVPQPAWNEKNMRYVLCAFPLVGVVCAVAYGLWAALCGNWPVPDLLEAAGYCLAPVLITGGIHLDGYADTCDALASYADAAKRQEILKDPHCGAFALICVCSYFVAYFALCASLTMDARTLACLGLGFVLERALSGWAWLRCRWPRILVWPTPLPRLRIVVWFVGSWRFWRSCYRLL